MKRLWMTVLSGLLLTIALFSGAARTSAYQAAPTSVSAAGSNLLPSGTLILSQKNQLIAVQPNGKPVSLTPERYGPQAAGNGKIGVRFEAANNAVNLLLVDNATGQAKPIPQATGLSSPQITWKRDGSGFAYFDLVAPGKTVPNAGAILYYDAASNATKVLIPAPAAGQIATSIAWSPDGRYLLYSVGQAGAEGAGGPNTKPFLFDSTSGASTALPQDAAGFNQWDRAGKGFLAQRGDIASGVNQIVYFGLDALTQPKALTPASTLDLLADISPDGKRIVVSSATISKTTQIANLYIMNLDGSSRRAITDFKANDQAITALVWGLDGIYYSLSGAGGDTTWRIDLDGKNARQVAIGTLIDIIGSR